MARISRKYNRPVFGLVHGLCFLIALTTCIEAKAEPRRAGDVWREPLTGIEFVWVSEGCYQMGQTASEKQYLTREVGEEKYLEYYADETPRHKVCVGGFWLGKYEVTVDQFQQFVKAVGYISRPDRAGSLLADRDEGKKQGISSRKNPGMEQPGRHPAINVTWNDAKAMANWLSETDSGAFRLPTEAEWEYACRAGTPSIRYWGDDPSGACRYANVSDRSAHRAWSHWDYHHCDDGHTTSAPVGSFKPNHFGLYDMIGNLWEWTEDVYAPDAYHTHGLKDPLFSNGTLTHVLRGGSWSVAPRGARCANRDWGETDSRDEGVGFRILKAF